MTTPILAFLSGSGLDNAGRTWASYFDFDDAAWEECHQHIQWMFPLPEASKMQPSSPVAIQDDYDQIALSPILRAKMAMSLGRYLLFLHRTSQWRVARDHNHLRITRVIRCLTWCGLNDQAIDFCDYVVGQVGDLVGKQTVWFWTEALKRDPAWLD
jgi:hypothetical protein